MPVPFDTFEAIHQLTAAGFTDAQAHAVSDLLKQTALVSAEQLVTKADLATAVGMLKADLAAAVGMLKAEIATLRGDVANLRWIGLACLGVLLSLAYKLWLH